MGLDGACLVQGGSGWHWGWSQVAPQAQAVCWCPELQGYRPSLETAPAPSRCAPRQASCPPHRALRQLPPPPPPAV